MVTKLATFDGVPHDPANGEATTFDRIGIAGSPIPGAVQANTMCGFQDDHSSRIQ